MAADGDLAHLAELAGGRAILGRAQFLPGYCILLSVHPDTDRLTDLPRSDRLVFLSSMERLGEAVEIVCRRRDPAFRRINLEIQGNLVPSLHAHVWPRYEWEPEEHRRRQVGWYPPESWHEAATQLGRQHLAMRDELRAELGRLAESTAAG